MSSPQDEIDALIAKVAALTARVYQLEQKVGLEPEASQQLLHVPPERRLHLSTEKLPPVRVRPFKCHRRKGKVTRCRNR